MPNNDAYYNALRLLKCDERAPLILTALKDAGYTKLVSSDDGQQVTLEHLIMAVHEERQRMHARA